MMMADWRWMIDEDAAVGAGFWICNHVYRMGGGRPLFLFANWILV